MDRARCLYHVCSVKPHLRMRDPGPSAGLNYEQQILEQQLVQRQNPEGAAPPALPLRGGQRAAECDGGAAQRGAGTRAGSESGF